MLPDVFALLSLPAFVHNVLVEGDVLDGTLPGKEIGRKKVALGRIEGGGYMGKSEDEMRQVVGGKGPVTGFPDTLHGGGMTPAKRA